MNRIDAIKFALAGNATFTVVSRLSGNRFTYKVTKQDGTPWFRVGVLTGPDNMSNYTYVGSIGWDRERYPDPKFFARRGVEAPPSARGMEWLVRTAFTNDTAWERVEFHHAGRCGRCGRTLTVPESIETGFGPECATKV
jgi:hypothetical protein